MSINCAVLVVPRRTYIGVALVGNLGDSTLVAPSMCPVHIAGDCRYEDEAEQGSGGVEAGNNPAAKDSSYS